MEIWLKQGKTKFRLAVLPPEYELTSESGNTQVVINSFGEVNLLGKRKLKTVSFSSFFPKNYNSSLCSYKKFPTPKESVKKIEKMKNKGVLHLTMTNTPVNMDCTIESFTWGENDGSEDINFTLEFKEYRKPEIKGKKKKEKVTKKVALPITQRPVKEIEDTIYTVKKNDDLCKIAKNVTGSSANWRALYLQNLDVIGDNPRSLFPGQRLVVKV
ncbi:MAG: LysM peptidoglycan-binding domain-containing protein [Lachnospiraceae bacterium]|nr:LysM peptidoglycan-binding domain-containing protein [Lachnospiraceae bacterium]